MTPSRSRAVALLCLAGLPAAAGPTDIPGETPACAKAEDAIDCLSRLADRSEARVRAGLAKARAAIARSGTIEAAGTRPEALEALERTQRAWRSYVRARCEGEVPVAFTGGTGRNHAVLTCLRIHGERRATELADFAGLD
ncbi:lysozyme inhibitor LprI family protein [Methylobacterium sp. A54F]